MPSLPATLPTADAALALIKPKVRAQSAYTLQAPEARRKLNQNESPFDVPAALKDAVLARLRADDWNRYPPFSPWRCSSASPPSRLDAGRYWSERFERADPGHARRYRREGTTVVSRPTFTLYAC